MNLRTGVIQRGSLQTSFTIQVEKSFTQIEVECVYQDGVMKSFSVMLQAPTFADAKSNGLI